MLLLSHVTALAALVSCTSAAAPYSTWMADSFISRGVSANRGYTQAVLYRGFETAFNKTSDLKYYNYIKAQVDTFVSSTGVLGGGYAESKYSLDDIRIGGTLIYLYQRTKLEKYKTAALELRNQLNSHPRTPSGGFWHRKVPYKNQMWLDGIYMASPFYAQWTAFYTPTNTTAWTDIALQFSLIEKYTSVPSHPGLYFHGYDESKSTSWADPTTGACPHVWDRALGWYFMALIDVLDYFPQSHPGHANLVSQLKRTAAAVIKAQDVKGGWWLIMTPGFEGKAKNYIESSATAMFTYALLKSVRLGYLDGATYLPPAKKAWGLMVEEFAVPTAKNAMLNWEGTVEVGSLSGKADFDYYTSVPLAQNDLKGAGPFIYAAAEFERL